MAIIDPKTGKKLTRTRIKSYIKSRTGWTDTQYKKQMDLMRNRLRNYETITGATQKENVAEFIYKLERSKQRYGADYEPTDRTKAILSTTAASTGSVRVVKKIDPKTGEVTAEISGLSRAQKSAQISALMKTYGGLSRVSNTVKYLFETYGGNDKTQPDIYTLSRELRAYSETLNAQRKERRISVGGATFEGDLIYE